MKRPLNSAAAAVAIVTLLVAAPSAAHEEQTTNDVAQLKATVSAVFSELQRERERTAALTRELAKVRREAEAAAMASSPNGIEAVQQKQAAEGAIADLQQLLQLEKEKTAALTQSLKATRQAMTASAEPQPRVFDEAPARATALAGEPAGIRRAIGARAAQSQKAVDEGLQQNLQQKQRAEGAIADLQQLLQREQEKTAALTQEVGAARQAMTANAEQGRALDQAQARAATLATELAGARRAIESQAQSQKAADEALQQNLQQKQRAEGAIADLRQLLQQEQNKTAALTQEVSTARQAMTANAEQRRALDQAQARAAGLALELAGARRAIESQTRSQKAADEALQNQQQNLQQKQAAAGAIAELQPSGQRNGDRAEAVARDFASAPRTIDRRVAAAPAAKSIVHVTQVVKTTTTESPNGAAAQGNAETTKLIARAGVLLGQGNIGAARIVLERAAESGNVQASFMLAETYDPIILSAWGTYGTRGEAAKAREHYSKAHTGGMREAKQRLDALRQ